MLRPTSLHEHQAGHQHRLVLIISTYHNPGFMCPCALQVPVIHPPKVYSTEPCVPARSKPCCVANGVW